MPRHIKKTKTKIFICTLQRKDNENYVQYLGFISAPGSYWKKFIRLHPVPDMLINPFTVTDRIVLLKERNIQCIKDRINLPIIQSAKTKIFCLNK